MRPYFLEPDEVSLIRTELTHLLASLRGEREDLARAMEQDAVGDIVSCVQFQRDLGEKIAVVERTLSHMPETDE